MSKRIYKEAMAENTAFEILQEDAGSHFDPVIVESFLEIRREVHRYLVERMKAEELRREGA